jgi:hypothetical protein
MAKESWLGRYRWFRCPACRWKGARHHSAKKCHACGAALQKLGRAAPEDMRPNGPAAEGKANP